MPIVDSLQSVTRSQSPTCDVCGYWAADLGSRAGGLLPSGPLARSSCGGGHTSAPVRSARERLSRGDPQFQESIDALIWVLQLNLSVEAAWVELLAAQRHGAQRVVLRLRVAVEDAEDQVVAGRVARHPRPAVPGRARCVFNDRGLKLRLRLSQNLADTVGVRPWHPVCILQAPRPNDGDLEKRCRTGLAPKCGSGLQCSLWHGAAPSVGCAALNGCRSGDQLGVHRGCGVAREWHRSGC
mmetsp:Transcript_32434/g.93052  ORF Transcript_32434/g.93052 Transcript_32434/m.93052 type:complete len:240 (-) Transcript_32434:374-1093(-)